jgi:hypothetical protein
MCFYIDKKNCPKAKIAEKDIKVYKQMTIEGKRFISPCRCFYYKPNKVYSSILDYDQSYFPLAITIITGFHSYSTLEKGRIRQWSGVIALCEFIIPKGSEYYYNSNKEEYVSNKIKWTGRVWRTDRWIPFKGETTDKMKIY